MSGCARPGDGQEGGSDKREWSILQNLEVEHRGEIIDRPEIRKVAEYIVISVPHHESGKRWLFVVLNGWIRTG